MKKQYEFYSFAKGGKSIITIENDKLTISRPGVMSKLSMGFKGEKTILIKNITSVQMKLAGFARGYIQFTIAGELAKRTGITAGELDENIVYFDGTKNSKANEYTKEIKNYIEEYNNSNNNAVINKEDDKYDKLTKLKKLLDDNTITQEEFEKEKNKLLNE